MDLDALKQQLFIIFSIKQIESEYPVCLEPFLTDFCYLKILSKYGVCIC